MRDAHRSGSRPGPDPQVVRKAVLRRSLTERLTASRRVRCGLVELLKDGVVALRHELEHEFGFEARVVSPTALSDAGDVDFFAVTSFYAASIRSAVQRLDKPLVVLTVHPGLKDAVEGECAKDP